VHQEFHAIPAILNYFWLIPFFPALGSLVNGIFGRKYFSRRVIHLIACGTVLISLILSILCLSALIGLPAEERLIEKEIYTWIPESTSHTRDGATVIFKIAAGYQLDPLSAVMLIVVCGVGFLIHVYSIGYMAHEEGKYYRFFCYMNLFTFAMLTLVLGNNFLVMFVGWEGVGLCSYLLIGFWFKKKSAADAGKKAFVVNRIGDLGFLMGMLTIFYYFGTLDLTEVMHNAHHIYTVFGAGIITTITLCLFVGAIGKSAQIPLYVWLPDAMEGPTPVSALIHAATMVTAGVYMVARCSELFVLAPISMTVVAVVGVATALYSASIGLVQNDIKRVLAYSTVSQLGYMFLACGVGAFAVGIFHLMTHAFFKGLLFLGAGSVIHAMSGEQDIRYMGGLKKHIPRTYWTFLFATFAIAGIFPFAGFFSKDEILWKSFEHHFVLWLAGAIAAGMTAFYMFRLLFMTFWGSEERIDPEKKKHIHESPNSMTIPLVILAILSLIGGFVGVPHALPLLGRIEFLTEKFNINSWLAPVIAGGAHGPAGHGELGVAHHGDWLLEVIMMGVSIAIALIGIYLAYLFYIKKPELPKKLAENFRSLYQLVLEKYRVDELYDFLFVNHIKWWCNAFIKVDNHVIDGAVNGSAWFTRLNSSISIWYDTYIVDGLVNLIGWTVKINSFIFRRCMTGYIQNYALIIIFGVVAITCIYLFF